MFKSVSRAISRSNIRSFNQIRFAQQQQQQRSYATKPFLYAKTHEWAQEQDKEGVVKIGISDVAQHKLGEIIHLEFHVQPLQAFNKGDVIAEVESVKSVNEIYAPFSGVVVNINLEASDNPSLLNTSPETDGWLAVVKADNFAQDKSELLDSTQYKEHCDKEDEDH